MNARTEAQAARVFEVLDIVTKPVQFAINGIKAVLMVMATAAVFVLMPIWALFTLTASQRNIVAKLDEQPAQHRAIVNFDTRQMIDASATGVVLKPLFEYKNDTFRLRHGIIPSTWPLENILGIGDSFDDSMFDWTRGKEAVMYRAYAEAAISTANLRQLLQNAKPGATIHLPDAPKVGLYYIDPVVRLTAAPETMVTGVCPTDGTCTKQDHMYRVAHDITYPSLTAGQDKAVGVMEGTMSSQFWLEEAHRNGVYDMDAIVITAATQNKATLLAEFQPDFTPAWRRLFGMAVFVLVVASPFLLVLWLLLRRIF